MKTYREKEDIENLLVSNLTASGIELYGTILDEIKRLWLLEEMTRKFMSSFPSHGFKDYPYTSLENRIKERLEITKKLMEALK